MHHDLVSPPPGSITITKIFPSQQNEQNHNIYLAQSQSFHSQQHTHAHSYNHNHTDHTAADQLNGMLSMIDEPGGGGGGGGEGNHRNTHYLNYAHQYQQITPPPSDTSYESANSGPISVSNSQLNPYMASSPNNFASNSNNNNNSNSEANLISFYSQTNNNSNSSELVLSSNKNSGGGGANILIPQPVILLPNTENVFSLSNNDNLLSNNNEHNSINNSEDGDISATTTVAAGPHQFIQVQINEAQAVAVAAAAAAANSAHDFHANRNGNNIHNQLDTNSVRIIYFFYFF
jgi:hypothetical protein